MTTAPAGIAADAAQLRQNVTLSVIKQSAQQGQAIANLLEEAVDSSPIDGPRGTNVNIKV